MSNKNQDDQSNKPSVFMDILWGGIMWGVAGAIVKIVYGYYKFGWGIGESLLHKAGLYFVLIWVAVGFAAKIYKHFDL